MVLIHLYVTHQAGLRNRYLVSNKLSGLFFSSQTILKASKKSTKPSMFKPGLSAWNSTGTVWCVITSPLGAMVMVASETEPEAS